MRPLLAFVLIAAGLHLAHADPKREDIAGLLSNNTNPKTPRFVFDTRGLHVDTAWVDANPDHTDKAKLVDPTIGIVGKVWWVASRVQRRMVCYGLGPNNECKDNLPRDTNALLLLEPGTEGWDPIAAHIAIPIADKAAAKAVAGGAKLDAITKQIDPKAADAEKVFEASLADSKQMAATVSKRKEAVLVGSAPGEKFVGGKAVSDRLTKWKLAFTIHDGVQAGTSTSGAVAWVAANLDARPVGKTDAKPVPYRALVFYEKTGTAWQLVALQFSFADPTPP